MAGSRLAAKLAGGLARRRSSSSRSAGAGRSPSAQAAGAVAPPARARIWRSKVEAVFEQANGPWRRSRLDRRPPSHPGQRAGGRDRGLGGLPTGRSKAVPREVEHLPPNCAGAGPAGTEAGEGEERLAEQAELGAGRRAGEVGHAGRTSRGPRRRPWDRCTWAVVGLDIWCGKAGPAADQCACAPSRGSFGPRHGFREASRGPVGRLVQVVEAFFEPVCSPPWPEWRGAGGRHRRGRPWSGGVDGEPDTR